MLTGSGFDRCDLCHGYWRFLNRFLTSSGHVLVQAILRVRASPLALGGRADSQDLMDRQTGLLIAATG
jgi:hypothetical protein